MKLLKLYHTVRHLHVSQMVARARLTLRRQYNQAFSDSLNREHQAEKPGFSISDTSPGPLFEPRSGKFNLHENVPERFTLTFLNRSKSFGIPVDWHPAELETGTRLWKLNLHYMEYLEEADDTWFVLLVEDWIRQNPPFREGYWLDSWNSYALSIRTVVWMQQLSLRKDRLDPQFIQVTAESIHKQLQFLEENLELDIRGNHLVKNMKALLWGASFFGDSSDTGRWQKKGEKLLRSIQQEQILPDGMHYERSPAYHCQVLADLMECYSLLNQNGLKSELKETLQNMGNALADLTHPDGNISLFNDGGLNMTYLPEELQDQLERITGKKGVASGVIDLEAAGYFGLRKNGLFFLFDAGKIGPDELPAHGHGDIFSFELSFGQDRIFVDKGVYEYNQGYHRKASRSTLSHNTLNLVHLDQCDFYGSFRVGRRANVKVNRHEAKQDSLRLEACHDGYRRLAGKPSHCRSIDLNDKRLIIEDNVIGGDGQPAEARFLLHPDVDVSQAAKGHVQIVFRDHRLAIQTDCRTDIQDTKWYPDFGISLPTKQIIIYLGNAPCTARYQITFS